MSDICEHGWDRSLVDQDGTPLCDQCEPAPRHTVPWDPGGEEVSGRAIRAVRMSAELAISEGWTAATLQARARWNEISLPGALVRTAVRWGLIP